MDGSIDALSAVQMNKNVEGLDASAKYILKQKEFLSVILHLAVPEYEDYTQEEIMGMRTYWYMFFYRKQEPFIIWNTFGQMPNLFKSPI